MRKKERRAIPALVLLLASLLAATVLAEFILRATQPIFTTGIQQAYEYDSVLGVRLRKSIDLVRITDHRAEIHSNRLGTANFQEDFSSYRRIIFALGDSYTQGTGVPQDESYPHQLDVLINSDSLGRYRKLIGVVNLGLAAYGGEQSLLVLNRYAKIFPNPAACLYLGSENDSDDDVLFKSGARHSHLVLGNPRWGKFTPALIWIGNLQVVLRLKLLLADRRLRDLRSSQSQRVPQESSRAYSAAPVTVAQLQWPVIERIVASCTAAGGISVLSWSKPPNLSGSYDWLKKKAESEQIPFNDWYARVVSVQTAQPNLPVFNAHSSGHYRGWVNGEIAAGFATALRDLKSP